MHNIELIEETYKKYTTDLHEWAPESILEINMDLLEKMGIASAYKPEMKDYTLNQKFQCLESDDKITLVNDCFVVWIVPELLDGEIISFTIIALNDPYGPPKLEIGFITRGIFNSSNLILRILDKLLTSIAENEETMNLYR